MERQVKERLVGAAVLVAAAIILIPEMLSGPKRDARPSTVPQTSADGSLKTYTIDLNRSPGAPIPAPLDERVPPPEEISSAPSSPANSETEVAAAEPSENQAQIDQASPERDEPNSTQTQVPERVASEPVPRPATSAPSPTETSATKQSPPALREPIAAKPIAPAPAAPTSRGWAVQLGSFSSRATADRLVKDLSQQGQSAFVMPVKSSNSTLYRVRIGPFAERAMANKALSEVKGRIANAAVVAHP
ncbi:MAG TPA: SPOR domain-containing protein [Steroidobacteraceae bacterium]|nr:SPOR domain-containing protein [Steroidobacteraceae bacterium]